MSEAVLSPVAETATLPTVPTLIRQGQLQADTWQVFVPVEGIDLPADDGDWVVPLATWQASAEVLKARRHPVGILFKPDDDPLALAPAGKLDANGIALIAIDFPLYTDGRGYSIAQILRTRLGWTGELRAVGDVMIDTIHYQARCGFDSFLLKAGHDPQLALEAFNAFSFHYQKTYPKPKREA